MISGNWPSLTPNSCLPGNLTRPDSLVSVHCWRMSPGPLPSKSSPHRLLSRSSHDSWNHSDGFSGNMEAEARTLMVDKQSFDMLLGPLEAREKKNSSDMFTRHWPWHLTQKIVGRVMMSDARFVCSFVCCCTVGSSTGVPLFTIVCHRLPPFNFMYVCIMSE